MKQLVIKPPRLPDEEVGSASHAAFASLMAGEACSNLTLSNHNYARHSVKRAVFERCRLREINFTQSVLPHLELSDVLLHDCDLANAEWRESSFHRVEMSGCRLLGLNANEARLENVIFHDCNASLCQFRFGLLRAVRFENCNLRGADFQESDLRGVVFKDCDLRETQMSFAKLKDADLRGSQLDGLCARADDLRGVIVEPLQAALLAGLLGLQVKWSDADDTSRAV